MKVYNRNLGSIVKESFYEARAFAFARFIVALLGADYSMFIWGPMMKEALGGSVKVFFLGMLIVFLVGFVIYHLLTLILAVIFSINYIKNIKEYHRNVLN